MQDKIKLEISPRSVALSFLVILSFFVAWELRSVFFMFFIAFIISAALRPYVKKLTDLKVPKMLAIALIYGVALSTIMFFLLTIVNEAWYQLTNLISQLPNLVYSILTNLSLPDQLQFIDPEIVKESLKELVTSLLKLDGGLFSSGISGAWGILSFASGLTIILGMITILSLYLLARDNSVGHSIVSYLPHASQKRFLELFQRIEEKLGKWFRAQIFLMLLAGVVSWIGLTLPALFLPNYTLHNYALPIAMLVSLLEIVPGTGLSVGAILSLLIALSTQQTFMIIYAPLLFIGMQQLEGMVIIPKLMKKVIGLDPIITLLSLVSGFILFQVVGAILIVPILAVIQIVIEFYSEDIKAQLR
jgi:predicted PurR-regulated permease PerM